MNTDNVVQQSSKKFKQAVDHFGEDLKNVRTGRAHPSMLDGLMVEAYGSPMPIIQVGNVTAPEAQLLQVTPFDPGNLQAIANAVRNNQALGLNPMDDGKVVRIPIPPLTEDRRRDYVKLVGQKMEDAMISLRNIRRDCLDVIEGAKKDKSIGEDDAKRLQTQIEENMNEAKANIEELAKVKEQEILKV